MVDLNNGDIVRLGAAARIIGFDGNVTQVRDEFSHAGPPTTLPDIQAAKCTVPLNVNAIEMEPREV
jgi:hypothetical protein